MEDGAAGGEGCGGEDGGGGRGVWRQGGGVGEGECGWGEWVGKVGVAVFVEDALRGGGKGRRRTRKEGGMVMRLVL